MSLKKHPAFISIIAIISLCWTAFQASGWHAGGHKNSTSLAIKAIEDRLPEFFIEGKETIYHFTADPDLLRPRQLPQLRNAEGPEHYFDVELIRGEDIPDTRYEFYALCYQLETDPVAVGALPYAVSEWTQRLAVAFAEYRRWPDNEDIRSKCLMYAGMLAHYAQDMGQPLHLTVHFDGRLDADGRSPRSGIHEKVDALLGKIDIDDEALLNDIHPQVLDDLMEAIRREIANGHALVDRVYDLEVRIPEANTAIADEETLAFTRERMTSSAMFTASLFLTAWEMSSDKNLIPEWHTR